GVDGLAITAAPKGAPVYAVKLGGNGELDDNSLAWTSPEREVSSDVSTPAVADGTLCALNSGKKIPARVDPATGKADWIGRLGTRTKLEATLTIADGKIYVQYFKGEDFVVASGPEFRILHTASMGDGVASVLRSSVAIVYDHLFTRTGSKLYCIGE